MIQIAAAVIGGLMQKSASDKAASRAIEVGNANADDLLRITALNGDEIRRISGLNSDAVLQTANLNASSVMEVGFANAEAIVQSTMENVDIESMQYMETLRRHQIQELKLAGEIRAATGASGVRIGQGSPLEVLHEAISSGYGERQYMANYFKRRLMMIGKHGMRQAQVTMMDASSKAKMMTEVASIQAAITREEGASRARMLMNDADANAASMRRGGQLIATQARAQGTASLVGSIMSGVNSYMQYGSPFGGGTTSNIMPGRLGG